MRRLLCMLPLAVFWQASFFGAELAPNRPELAPYNKMGVTWGHIHLHPKDRYKETMAFLSLGAVLGNNLSPNVPLVFPGILILLQEGQKGAHGRKRRHRGRSLLVPSLEFAGHSGAGESSELGHARQG